MRGEQTRRAAWAVTGGLLLIGVVPLAAESAAQDWPQFRGVHRDGISAETGLGQRWPTDGPRELWRRPIGEGYSAVTVAGDRLYTMYGADHEGGPRELAAAFDARTGKELWRVPLGEKYDTEFGNGPRSTPSVSGDTVFVLDSHGTLAALSVEDGAERWRVGFQEAFGAKRPYWGYSASPLVDGDQVVIEAGGAEGKSYVALDRKTGQVEWTLGDGASQPGYNSAITVELGGERRYVYVVGTELLGVDPRGKQIFSHPWPQGETHATPVFVPPNRIFASGAEGVGGVLLEVRDSDGSAVVEEVWKAPFMRNHFSASVLHDGHIYGFDNATLKCISAETGEMAWAKRGLGKGSLIYADAKLFVLSDKGKLVLVEATPEAYRERGAVQALEGRSWTAPALAAGKLYLRNHEEMVVYDLGG